MSIMAVDADVHNHISASTVGSNCYCLVAWLRVLSWTISFNCIYNLRQKLLICIGITSPHLTSPSWVAPCHLKPCSTGWQKSLINVSESLMKSLITVVQLMAGARWVNCPDPVHAPALRKSPALMGVSSMCRKKCQRPCILLQKPL